MQAPAQAPVFSSPVAASDQFFASSLDNQFSSLDVNQKDPEPAFDFGIEQLNEPASDFNDMFSAEPKTEKAAQ